MKTLAQAIFVAFLLTVSVVASATPVLWTFSGVRFSDGSTASGSFVFDADTVTYSDVLVTTTSAPGTTYDTSEVVTTLVFGSDATGLNLVDNFGLADLTGQRILNLDFAAPLTNAAGVVNIVIGFPSFEGTCGVPSCASDSVDRTVINAEGLIGVSIPEPTTIALAGLGLIALGFIRRRGR